MFMFVPYPGVCNYMCNKNYMVNFILHPFIATIYSYASLVWPSWYLCFSLFILILTQVNSYIGTTKIRSEPKKKKHLSIMIVSLCIITKKHPTFWPTYLCGCWMLKHPILLMCISLWFSHRLLTLFVYVADLNGNYVYLSDHWSRCISSFW